VTFHQVLAALAKNDARTKEMRHQACSEVASHRSISECPRQKKMRDVGVVLYARLAGLSSGCRGIMMALALFAEVAGGY